jgi:HD-GYP domain-containing protein (c-di-GMP phosphodiesterase class II)
LLGREIGMPATRLAVLAETAQLLDIGLVGLPPHVAHRSQPLTADEEAEYDLHPMRGLDLVRDLGMELEQVNGLMHHHERHDGYGYPMGLAGPEIPEFARILAICDAFDDMTSGKAGNRYSVAVVSELQQLDSDLSEPDLAAVLSVDDAMRQLRDLAGTHFDPPLVSAFSRAVNEHQQKR